MSKRCGAKGAVRCKRRGLFTFSFSEREGFEPSVRIELVQRISNQPLSTTQPSLLCIEPSFNSIMCHWEGFAHRFAEGLGPLRCRPPPSAEKQPWPSALRFGLCPGEAAPAKGAKGAKGAKEQRQTVICSKKKITLALSWCFLLDFQQVCQLLQSFTAKFGMDWRGSTEAKSTRVSAEQSSGEVKIKKIGQNQFAFSISQLKPLLAFHLIPIKTACLAAAL